MTTFEEGAERNKALGIWGALGGAGAAVGVLLGGVLTKYFGWEWIFFINVPVGVLAFVLAPRFVRESRSEHQTSPDVAGAVDGHGADSRCSSTRSRRRPTTAGARAGRSCASWSRSLLLVAFVAIEARAKHPLMPFSIFRVRTVAGANIVGLLLGAVTFSNFFVLTLYVQQVLGYSALQTGVAFAATAGSAVLWAGLAQFLSTKIGPKPVMAAGFVAMTAGMLWYSQMPADGTFASSLLPGYLLVGFALPFTWIPVSIAALAGVQEREAGLASGLISTAQQVGGAIGVAVASSVSISHFNAEIKDSVPFPEAFTSGAQWAFWVMAGVSVAALVATLTLIRRDELEPAGEAVTAPI